MREIERLRSDNDSLVASLDAQRERVEALKAARQRDRKTIRKIKIVGAVVLCVSVFSVVKAFF
jgi:predicted RNase H-like nuclease (RuvC/YqgF family)